MTTLRLRNANQYALKHNLEPMGEGDVLTHGFDFSRLLGANTISSATWTARDNAGNTANGVTVGSVSNASGISSAPVTAVNSGQYLIDCQMTDSAGNIRSARASLRVMSDGERR